MPGLSGLENLRSARGTITGTIFFRTAKFDAETAWHEIEKELHGCTDNDGRHDAGILADGESETNGTWRRC